MQLKNALFLGFGPEGLSIIAKLSPKPQSNPNWGLKLALESRYLAWLPLDSLFSIFELSSVGLKEGRQTIGNFDTFLGTWILVRKECNLVSFGGSKQCKGADK